MPSRKGLIIFVVLLAAGCATPTSGTEDGASKEPATATEYHVNRTRLAEHDWLLLNVTVAEKGALYLHTQISVAPLETSTEARSLCAYHALAWGTAVWFVHEGGVRVFDSSDPGMPDVVTPSPLVGPLKVTSTSRFRPADDALVVPVLVGIGAARADDPWFDIEFRLKGPILHVEEVAAGSATCGTSLAEFDEGTWTKTAAGTRAENLRVAFETQESTFGRVFVSSDVAHTVEIEGPESSSSAVGPGDAERWSALRMDDAPPGAYTLRIPELTAVTDFTTEWLFLDLPAWMREWWAQKRARPSNLSGPAP